MTGRKDKLGGRIKMSEIFAESCVCNDVITLQQQQSTDYCFKAHCLPTFHPAQMLPYCAAIKGLEGVRDGIADW
jgi:hypothetical protein